MLVYPQLTSGALSQFPAIRRRRLRTIVNAADDGSSVKLGDAGAATTEWQLSYTGLSDAELAALQQFFLSTEGSLNGFTFLDPSANLLAWSEMLTNSAWSAAPLLTLQSGVPDAAGGQNGWQLSNTGGGPQALSQTLNAPAGYGYCFSVYVRAAQPSSVTLTLGGNRTVYAVGTAWARIVASGSGDANGASVAFGIEIPAGAAIDVFGPQVEAQGAPSVYQTSTTGGVYPNARFRDDAFSLTTQGANRHSATVNIVYANHL
jgi:hypothetical protein